MLRFATGNEATMQTDEIIAECRRLEREWGDKYVAVKDGGHVYFINMARTIIDGRAVTLADLASRFEVVPDSGGDHPP